MLENDRGALTFANFHVFDGLRVTLVGRCQRAPEKISGAGGQQSCKEEDGEQRLEVFAAAAALSGAAGYDCLRCSSRYDCRITAAAAMSMSFSASRPVRPGERNRSAASPAVSASSHGT